MTASTQDTCDCCGIAAVTAQDNYLGPTRVRILHNGSGFAGDAPLPLSALLERLDTDLLEACCGEDCEDCYEYARSAEFFGERDADGRNVYADTGPIYPDAPHAVRFCGNFETCSHAFCIDTDDAEIIELLAAAIHANHERGIAAFLEQIEAEREWLYANEARQANGIAIRGSGDER